MRIALALVALSGLVACGTEQAAVGDPTAASAKAGGEAGPQGERGPTGPVGATGATGPAGPRGAPGERGEVGPMGPAGPSTGVAGPKGDTGERGPAGVAGATGAIGAQGPKGDRGEAGAGALWRDANGTAVPVLSVLGGVAWIAYSDSVGAVWQYSLADEYVAAMWTSPPLYESSDCSGIAYVKSVPVGYTVILESGVQTAYVAGANGHSQRIIRSQGVVGQNCALVTRTLRVVRLDTMRATSIPQFPYVLPLRLDVR